MVLVGFVVKRASSEAASTTQSIVDFLKSRGHEAVVVNSPSDIVEDMGFIVSNGGDGTVIHTARMVVERGLDIPIFPINSGRLGFLTEVDASEAIPEIAKILEGCFRVEEFRVLDAYLESERIGFAVNEVALSGPYGKLLNCRISLDGHPVASVRADKVIVSSPLGSTAYNLSAGGSIIHPHLKAISLSFVAQFYGSRVPPMVLPMETEILLSNIGEDPAYVITDGLLIGEKGTVGKGCTLKVTSSNRSFKLIYTRWNFYDRLSKKLLNNLNFI